jgi:hypothetical protein
MQRNERAAYRTVVGVLALCLLAVMTAFRAERQRLSRLSAEVVRLRADREADQRRAAEADQKADQIRLAAIAETRRARQILSLAEATQRYAEIRHERSYSRARGDDRVALYRASHDPRR